MDWVTPLFMKKHSTLRTAVTVDALKARCSKGFRRHDPNERDALQPAQVVGFSVASRLAPVKLNLRSH